MQLYMFRVYTYWIEMFSNEPFPNNIDLILLCLKYRKRGGIVVVVGRRSV